MNEYKFKHKKTPRIVVLIEAEKIKEANKILSALVRGSELVNMELIENK